MKFASYQQHIAIPAKVAIVPVTDIKRLEARKKKSADDKLALTLMREYFVHGMTQTHYHCIGCNDHFSLNLAAFAVLIRAIRAEDEPQPGVCAGICESCFAEYTTVELQDKFKDAVAKDGLGTINRISNHD